MTNEPNDPVKKRLWITLVVLLALLVAVAVFIAMLGGGETASQRNPDRISGGCDVHLITIANASRGAHHLHPWMVYRQTI